MGYSGRHAGVAGVTRLRRGATAVTGGRTMEACAPADATTTGRRSARRKGLAMSTIKEAATDFLSCRRIAVTGVSREPKEHGGNIVYKRLKERGYEVFAVNPNADAGRGRTARTPTSAAIPGGVEAVVIIATRPEHAARHRPGVRPTWA